MDKRLEIVERLKSLEEDLETLGSGVVRVVDPGKKSQYYCPRAKAIFRHK